MTGAEAAIRTAVNLGVEVCFANPGTTEMDVVTALDGAPEMRTVLGLFEGVCTGMADGYFRMAGRPALTLLHLGVGLGNGIANLHNARKARSGIVNIIGDHPAEHLPYDPPLALDIATLARPVSTWSHTPASSAEAASSMAQAIAAAVGPPGGIATLIMPADVMRESAEGPVEAQAPPGPRPVEDLAVETAAKALREDAPSVLLLSGPALGKVGLEAAHRVAAATGCKVMADCFPARLERGAGLPPIDRLPYFPELILERLAGTGHLILVGASPPVSFFLYPDYPSSLVPEGCEVVRLGTPEEDIVGGLEALADAVGAAADGGSRTEGSVPDPPSGALDTRSIGAAIAAALPEGAIVADESATSGGPAYFLTRSAAPHSALYLTGGGIGMGLPLAGGAAIACPDRPVLALQGDGGGMYTLQALWTQAREGLNVTNIIFSNRKYQILEVELARAGVTQPGAKTKGLTSLANPELDWRQLAQGMGVPAVRPDSAEAFFQDLTRALVEPGPHLIELVL